MKNQYDVNSFHFLKENVFNTSVYVTAVYSLT